MSNTGVSYQFIITNQPFKTNSAVTVSRYKDSVVNPPSNTVYKGYASSSITKWINPYPDIAFEKIVLPQWDGISKYTTEISNQPDYIKDYHFISIMRCVDFYNSDFYDAVINIEADSPKAE